MSAIGDYIHYTAKGYNKYGISFNNESSKKYNYEMQKNKIKNQLKYSGMSNKEKGRYQSSLNYIFSDVDNSNSNINQIRTYITKILKEKFGDSMGNIDWAKGNITKASRAIRDTNQKINVKANQKQIFISTLLSRIKLLEAIQEDIVEAKDKKQLKEEIDKIYKNLEEILKIEKEYVGKDLELEKILKNNKKISIEKSKSLIDDINSLLKKHYSIPAINLQKGDLFEIAIALAPLMYKSICQEKMMDTMKLLSSNVVGDNRSSIVIDFGKFFSDKVDIDKVINQKYYYKENDTAISYIQSQEKIDVNLNWFVTANSNIGISAKNVNLNSGYNVHILSKSSLLYLLQDEPSDFVNHYFNIIAKHGDNARIEVNLGAAHEAMKYTLLYKALTGDTYERKGASIFLLNDNSQKNGGVKLYEIKDLFNKAALKVDDYVSITPKLEDLSIPNVWSETYTSRISNFLSYIHATKISVALKPKLFKP